VQVEQSTAPLNAKSHRLMPYMHQQRNSHDHVTAALIFIFESPLSPRTHAILSTPHRSAMPCSKTSKNLSQRRYKPAMYPCQFRLCPKACANLTGLSQHSASCKFNPANRWCY
jgi:hypothetical protein